MSVIHLWDRIVTFPRANIRDLAAIMVLCLISVALTTSLLLLMVAGLYTFASSSPADPGPGPRFVCTADAGGTILRCRTSSNARPPL